MGYRCIRSSFSAASLVCGCSRHLHSGEAPIESLYERQRRFEEVWCPGGVDSFLAVRNAAGMVRHVLRDGAERSVRDGIDVGGCMKVTVGDLKRALALYADDREIFMVSPGEVYVSPDRLLLSNGGWGAGGCRLETQTQDPEAPAGAVVSGSLPSFTPVMSSSLSETAAAVRVGMRGGSTLRPLNAACSCLSEPRCMYCHADPCICPPNMVAKGFPR